MINVLGILVFNYVCYKLLLVSPSRKLITLCQMITLVECGHQQFSKVKKLWVLY